jgi:holo-[acyl-carrier protein] synthase
LGIDVASVERVARALARHGSRFSERVLTHAERAELAACAGDRATAIAGRFAAKEAAFKALGGPGNVWWQQLEVRGSPQGAPALRLLGAAAGHAQRLGVTQCLVSITHDAGVAAAVVILEGGGAR